MSKPLLLGLLWLGQACLAAEPPDEPPLFNAAGYRQAHYRSPTPTAAEGVATLDTAALQDLLRRQPGPQGSPPGVLPPLGLLAGMECGAPGADARPHSA